MNTVIGRMLPIGRDRVATLVLALLLAVSAVGQAQELTAEQDRFTAADALLNGTWQEAWLILPAAVFGELQLDQRQWLDYRDWYAAEVARIAGGMADVELQDSPVYWEQLAVATDMRTEYLQAWLDTYSDGFASTGPLPGVWVDGFGGRMTLAAAGDGESVDFEISVVRGPTWHSGDIDGRVAFGERTARYTEDLPNGEVLRLTFILRGPQIEVIGEDTSWYHGARAYFDGLYVRVGE